MPTLAYLVRNERRRRGLRQREFAAVTDIGVEALRSIEQGLRFHDLDKLHKIALVFADGDKERAGMWLYQMITAMGYPLPTLTEVER